MKIAVMLSYDGTGFCGWQRQRGEAANGATSVQQTVEEALAQITREKPVVVGSGRTDSGVHSVGQVAHFVLKKETWELRKIQQGLNSILPQSIRALGIREVPGEFHAQRSAIKKQYSYYFQQGPCAIPHLEPYTRWIRKKLDTEAMESGLRLLLGEHDFKPFQGAGSTGVRTTVRRIFEADITWQSLTFPGTGLEHSGLVRVRVVGSGFLKQMVRGIAGTLLQIGENRREPSCFDEILKTGDRSLVGPTAPARALWQERIWYPDKFGMELTSTSALR